MKHLLPILCLFVFSCDELDSLLGKDDDDTSSDIGLSSISGYVYDSDGLPVENAYITLGYSYRYENEINRPYIPFEFELINSGIVNLWIQDDCEEVIRVLIDNEVFNPGTYSHTWDGRNFNDLYPPDGQYHLKLSLNGEIINSQYIPYMRNGGCIDGSCISDGYGGCFDYFEPDLLTCEYLAITNSDGFFEFTLDCLSSPYESEVYNETGQLTGGIGYFFEKIRFFADNGHSYGISDYYINHYPFNSLNINDVNIILNNPY